MGGGLNQSQRDLWEIVMKHGIVKALIFAVAHSMLYVGMVQAADPLPSWNEGAPKKAIVEFGSKVTKEGAPGFVPPANRIATFDNDGTLWAEQPMYVQLLFCARPSEGARAAASGVERQGTV